MTNAIYHIFNHQPTLCTARLPPPIQQAALFQLAWSINRPQHPIAAAELKSIPLVNVDQYKQGIVLLIRFYYLSCVSMIILLDSVYRPTSVDQIQTMMSLLHWCNNNRYCQHHHSSRWIHLILSFIGNASHPCISWQFQYLLLIINNSYFQCLVNKLELSMSRIVDVIQRCCLLATTP